MWMSCACAMHQSSQPYTLFQELAVQACHRASDAAKHPHHAIFQAKSKSYQELHSNCLRPSTWSAWDRRSAIAKSSPASSHRGHTIEQDLPSNRQDAGILRLCCFGFLCCRSDLAGGTNFQVKTPRFDDAARVAVPNGLVLDAGVHVNSALFGQKCSNLLVSFTLLTQVCVCVWVCARRSMPPVPILVET